jgi:hypothetical protein
MVARVREHLLSFSGQCLLDRPSDSTGKGREDDRAVDRFFDVLHHEIAHFFWRSSADAPVHRFRIALPGRAVARDEFSDPEPGMASEELDEALADATGCR